MRKPSSANLYLSQKERLGLSLLMLTLVVFIMVPYLWRPKINFAELSSLPKVAPIIKKSFTKNSHPPESKPDKPSPGELKSKNKITSEVIELFYFDPNNLNESASKKLGISPKAYNNLQKYLKAGGKIKKADDLQKIYGMDAELLQKLRPYLKIPETKTRSGEEGHPTTNSLPFTKKIEPFEINKATCEEWKSLPGIGDKLSARILKYKSALGGFIHKSQVCEVYGIDDSLCTAISRYLDCSPSLVKIKINSVDLDELEIHPYLNHKQAAFIINYRRQHQKIKDLKELESTGFFKKDELNKIEPYLDFQ
ncbi:MAG: helix-hairpin-helix domain-containing protein [Saprospiraceae bacterium]|nr:helix-hairpin-helix domain-containing protein [Candidatus Vicinibacter affinis]